jgi:hypothetical protein
MTSIASGEEWEGEETPDHRRYFPETNPKFIVDVSDKQTRLAFQHTDQGCEIYPTHGEITRVSSDADIIGDQKFLEFSDKEFVTFSPYKKMQHIFYKTREDFEKYNAEEKPSKTPAPKWFENIGLEGTL